MQSLLSIFLLFFCCSNAMANSWQLVKQQQGTQLYQQHRENGDFAVKAQLNIESNLSALLVLLNDTQHSHLWIANNQKVKVLARPSYHQAIVHSFFHAPWPVRDRDMVTHSYTSQDPQTLEVSIKILDVGHQYPRLKEYQRMTDISGLWRITPLQDRQVQISYEGTASPAGDIPQWLAEDLLRTSTFDTFLKLKQRLPSSEYQNKPLRGIKEP